MRIEELRDLRAVAQFGKDGPQVRHAERQMRAQLFEVLQEDAHRVTHQCFAVADQSQSSAVSQFSIGLIKNRTGIREKRD